MNCTELFVWDMDSGYSVNCREEFVWDIGDWIYCAL